MEKIKNIGSRVFDWIKKHRVLSILLCLLLIIFCFKGIVWIYNDIAYGRFVKIGKIENTKYNNHQYIKLEDGSVLLFIQNGIWSIEDSNLSYSIYHIEKNKVIKKETIINAYKLMPIASYHNNVYLMLIENSATSIKSNNYILQYDYKDDILLNKKIKTFPYTLSATYTSLSNNIVLILNEYPTINKNNKLEYNITLFEPKTLQSKIINKYQENQEDFTSIAPKGISPITTKLHYFNYKNINYIAKVKSDVWKKIEITLINTNNGKISNVDINQIEQHKQYSEKHNIRRKVIWLKNNSFLVITYPNFGKYIFFETYLLNGTEIVKQKNKVFLNNSIFHANRISPNNYTVIDGNKVLFFGGYDGIATTSWMNKTCFLYDINKNKIYRMNNFKYRIKNQSIEPIKKDILIFGGYREKSIFFDSKPLENIYLFKTGLKFNKGDNHDNSNKFKK